MNELFRRLLRHVKSGHYYDGRGGWTLNHMDAFEYADVGAAISAARHLEYESLELVMKFQDEQMDLSHPLLQLEERITKAPGS
jgi:hypothetical protein